MTKGLVGQDQLLTFVHPVKGKAPVDPEQVRGNDNTLRVTHNLHDNDATIHLQNSASADRPAAGVAGRTWIESDTHRVYFDDGAAWHEIAYVTTAAPINITGSRGGNVALANLLTALATQGLITDSTTP